MSWGISHVHTCPHSTFLPSELESGHPDSGYRLSQGPRRPPWLRAFSPCLAEAPDPVLEALGKQEAPALHSEPSLPRSYLSHELHCFSSGAGCRPETWASTCRTLDAWGRAGVLGERASPGQGLLILETPQGAPRAAGGKGDSWPARLGGGSPTLRLVRAVAQPHPTLGQIKA